MHIHNGSRSRRSGLSLLALLGALSVLSLGAQSADSNEGSVEETKATIEKWVETRRIISQERRDWALGKEMLNERIELVQQAIEKTRQDIDEAIASSTKAEQENAELTEERDTLTRSGEHLADVVTQLESRTKDLLKRLPDPLLSRVRPISQKIPSDPKDTQVSLSDRYLYVIGVLNEIDKFNREITVTSEFRDLPDGTSASVTTMYVGLGQAFYVGANGTAAGVGRPSENGWVWTPANEYATQIAQAIAVFNGEQVASFVRLPVEIE